MVGIRFSFALSAALLAVIPFAHAATAPNYRIVDRIKVPDGGFDYFTIDASTSRLYAPRTDFTTVIDLKTKQVSQLKAAARGHIFLPVPGTTLAVLTQRTGTVRIHDMAKDAVVADIPVGKNPDGAVYDPFTKNVFAMNHDSGNSTVIDINTRKPVANIVVGGELEFPVSDGAGKVFVNVANVPEIAVIDAKARTVTAHWKLNGCEDASGLAYIADAKLLVSSCANGVAKVTNATNGADVATIPIARGPDAVIYDASRKLAFIPCGTMGVLEVVSFADPTHPTVVQHVETQPGSRTGTIDPATGRIYMMASKPDPNGGRGARVPGSYEVLVVSP